MSRKVDLLLAVIMALVCHGGFLAAVGLMGWSLAHGLQSGLGAVPAPWAPWANAALALQFPLLHSSLLTRPGRLLLGRLIPGPRGRVLAVTTFVIVTCAQIVLTFAAWTPSRVVWWMPRGAAGAAAWVLFGASWLFLARAIGDAGAGLQSGAIGWWALLRGRLPRFGGMPTGGLFRVCRQPIYLGFLLVLLTAPVWTPDRLLLLSIWGPYCVLAPMLKERRFRAMYGDAFVAYQRLVPYFVPLLIPRLHDADHRRR